MSEIKKGDFVRLISEAANSYNLFKPEVTILKRMVILIM